MLRFLTLPAVLALGACAVSPVPNADDLPDCLPQGEEQPSSRIELPPCDEDGNPVAESGPDNSQLPVYRDF